MNAPLISIVVPFFNAENYLSEAIESCLAQTWRNIELILVDDGSTDSSPVIAHGFANPDIRVFSQVNQGAAAARNAGLAECSGTHVLFLDADDVLVPDAVETLLDSIGTASIAFGGWENFQGQVTGDRVDYSGRSGEPLSDFFVFRPVVSSALIRRDAIREPWNTGLTVWEVTDFQFKVVKDAALVVFVESIVTRIRQHQGADRISVRHDHFSPSLTSRFLCACRQQLQTENKLSKEVRQVIDQQLINLAYRMMRSGTAPACIRKLLSHVELDDVKNYPLFHRHPIYWLIHWLHGYPGMRLFFWMNRLLGRT